MKRLLPSLLAAFVALAYVSHEAVCADVFSAQNNNTWTCTVCGKTGNRGSSCPSCGARKPAPWICTVCGKKGNYNNFCSSCGAHRPGGSTRTGSEYYFILQKVTGDVVSFHAHNGTEIHFDPDGLTVDYEGRHETFSLSEVQRAVYGRSSGTKGRRTDADYSEEMQKALYVYRNDGGFNAFMQSNIRKISHSSQSLEIQAADSTYSIPYSAIDSLSFHGLETRYAKDVILLDPYIPYLSSCDSLSISFDKSLPKQMAVKPGSILLYEKLDSHFPYGFAARVLGVDTENGYACTCCPVGIEDVYDQLLVFGEYSVKPGMEGGAHESGQNQGFSGNFMSFKYGDVSISLSGDVDPSFSVSIVRRQSLPTSVVVSAGASYSFSASASGEINVETSRDEGKSASICLVPYMPIPDCPVVGVGLDACLFTQFSGKGSLSASAGYSGSFRVEGGYNGEMYATPSYKLHCSSKSITAKLEGTVSGGICFMPMVKSAGGLVDLVPEVRVGPEFTADLDLDMLNDMAAYDALKDNKFSLNIKADLSTSLKCSIFGPGEEFSLQPVSVGFPVKEWYYLPLFTEPVCLEPKRYEASVSTIPSRELLMPVDVGIDLMFEDEITHEFVDPEPYDSPGRVAVYKQFSDLDYCKSYKACPSVTLFGVHMQASPWSDIYLEPEVYTGGATDVTCVSAVLHGQLADGEYEGFSDYGIRYSKGGEEWTEVKASKDASGSFSIEVDELEEDTAYQYLAFLRFDGNEYLGAVETFITVREFDEEN